MAKLAPVEAAYLQFCTSAILSDSEELVGALPGFDALAEWKEKRPIFKSVKKGDRYYQEAQLLVLFCDISEALSSFKLALPNNACEIAERVCASVSKNKDIQAYRNFLVYMLKVYSQLLAKWIQIETGMIGKFTEQKQDALVQAQRLQAAGMNANYVQAQYKKAISTPDTLQALLKIKSIMYANLGVSLVTAIAKNMHNPDGIEQEVIDDFYGWVDAIESYGKFCELKPANNLLSNVKSEVNRNRNEYRRSSAYQKIVKQWWDERTEVKSQLESQLKEQQEAARQASTRTASARKKLGEAQLAQKNALSPHLSVVAAIEAEIEEAQAELKSLGLFKGKRKKELREHIVAKQEELAAAKSDLESVTAEHDKLVNAAKSELESCERSEQSSKTTLDSTRKKLEDPDVPQTYIIEHLH